MSAVVLNQKITMMGDEKSASCVPKVVSLATGTKSLPVSTLPKCHGLILHDCHAEILALRGLNYWLLCEIQRLLESESFASEWIEFVPPGKDDFNGNVVEGEYLPIRLRERVEISLFSTEAPCGDASMELLVAATEAAGRDITPWPSSALSEDAPEPQLPPGRGCFSNLGALRRKPARADAEISMSKSCTDKLTMKQFTGLLNLPVDLFVQLTDEVFLKRMVMYGDAWSETGYTRAFSAQGRLEKFLRTNSLFESQRPRFFEVVALPNHFERFEFEKGREVAGGQKSRVSNFSTLWIAAGDEDVTEVLVNGVKQGFKQFDERERKGSVVCRRNMMKQAARVAALLRNKGLSLSVELGPSPVISTYSTLKSMQRRSERVRLKRTILDRLGGWPSKKCEDNFDVSEALFPKQLLTDES